MRSHNGSAAAWLIVTLASAIVAHAQVSYTFSTLAGTAGTVVNSVDATGSAAQFDTPRGVAVDSSGTVYVADSTNHTIRKITAAGVVTTLAGTAGSSGSAIGTGSAARFNEPWGLAVDSAGIVYVADTSSHAIRKITPAGVVTTLAGANGPGSSDGSGTAAKFYEPRGVAVDSAGNLYVADYFYSIVRKVTAAGVVTTLAGTAGVTGSTDATGSAARFRDLNGIAVDSAGNVYVTDTSNRTVRKITAAGVVTTFLGTAGSSGFSDGTGATARFGEPRGLAIDSADNLYIADYGTQTIRKATAAGVVTTLAGTAPLPGSTDATGAAARFNSPSGVAVDSAGNVYVADAENDTIRKITAAGVVTTLAGLAGRSSSADGTGAAAKFEDPYDVAVDSAGNSYIVDSGAHCIRKVTPAGVVTTLAGLAGTFGSADGTGTSARFYAPLGAAVDSAGNVYVADSGNRTIRKITAAGVVTTLAGTAGSGGSTDGTGTAARFQEPHGIAVDSNGNVYVSDSSLSNLRKITPAGVVTTLAGSGTAGTADGTGTAAQFAVPFGITVDSAGNIFVCDHGNHSVRKVTPAGVVTTIAGLNGTLGSADGTTTTSRLRFPSDVAVDPTGNVFVADTDNQVIRIITPAGVVTTIAGGTVGSADGVGTAAQFYNPKGLAADSSGNLYVADRNNHTLRKGTVTAAAVGPTSRLSNLSVLTTLPAGGLLIVGLTMEGGAREVLLRASGPALIPLGVGGTMADPKLALYSGSTKVLENDTWSSSLSTTFASLGAFAFPASSKDAAFVQSLNGGYTVWANGTAGGTVLVEAYDLGSAMTPRLTNISARNFVGTGSDILVAGLTVAGTGTKRILIRAVGPTLASAFGLTTALSDPKLELYNAAGVKIDENDNWAPALSTTFSSVGAFALAANSKDAAFIATVTAGTGYTVKVSGVGGLTGEALVELYELP